MGWYGYQSSYFVALIPPFLEIVAISGLCFYLLGSVFTCEIPRLVPTKNLHGHLVTLGVAINTSTVKLGTSPTNEGDQIEYEDSRPNRRRCSLGLEINTRESHQTACYNCGEWSHSGSNARSVNSAARHRARCPSFAFTSAPSIPSVPPLPSFSFFPFATLLVEQKYSWPQQNSPARGSNSQPSD